MAMASIALRQYLSIPRQLFTTPFILFAPPLSTILGASWSIPLLPSLRELIPPFLLAVPKKKVSHSRKAMRSANKGLKDKQSK
jgi:large subunit ribosomal protein L32